MTETLRPEVLKIQYKNNYIQLDPNDIESVEMVHKFFKFMLCYVEDEKEVEIPEELQASEKTEAEQ